MPLALRGAGKPYLCERNELRPDLGLGLGSESGSTPAAPSDSSSSVPVLFAKLRLYVLDAVHSH